eukprot:scaffold1411_cov396-Prasinococcus_capsulatus_cf.AAC.26
MPASRDTSALMQVALLLRSLLRKDALLPLSLRLLLQLLPPVTDTLPAAHRGACGCHRSREGLAEWPLVSHTLRLTSVGARGGHRPLSRDKAIP